MSRPPLNNKAPTPIKLLAVHAPVYWPLVPYSDGQTLSDIKIKGLKILRHDDHYTLSVPGHEDCIVEFTNVKSAVLYKQQPAE